MPVTAKLSRNFYDKLGDAAANELVDWLNSVDLDVRSDLRTLNELNFARFDAKLEQRFAEQDMKLERRFAEQDVKIERRFAEQDMMIERRFAEFEQKFSAAQISLVRWMFAFWTTSIATQAGLFYLVMRAK